MEKFPAFPSFFYFLMALTVKLARANPLVASRIGKTRLHMNTADNINSSKIRSLLQNMAHEGKEPDTLHSS
jgi:hypothetical protein